MKVLFLIALIAVTGCSNKQSQEDLAKMLNDNPKILTDLIEKNPALIIDSIQKAAKLAQGDMAAKQQQNEQVELENSFKNPLIPNIRADELFVGSKDAKITIVEYSDFECPFCARGYATVKELLKKYDGKVKIVFKHLPLNFHPQAMISAQYYEAIRLQDPKKAIAFHDAIFENQSKLKEGKTFLDIEAKKLGVNLVKLNKDIKSDSLNSRIQEDVQEAAKFKMQGTPGFLVNGVPVRGAYPIEYFDQIIAKLK